MAGRKNKNQSQRAEGRQSLLEVPRNCWRIGRAEDACVLIDAESYFTNLYENLLRAERTIYILCWDIDSRQSLLPGQRSKDGYPTRLGELLDQLARQRPELEIYILAWDFAPIYITSREGFQSFKFGWQSHARLNFLFDNQHPLSASHHQKVVVLDDQIAYCGGLDLTGARWDSMRHDPGESRRRLPTGARYAPFHDVQMVVRGDPARWLGELCRERWRRGSGSRLSPPEAVSDPRRFVMPHENRFQGPRVAIARTVPAFKQARQVREIECLFIDLIATAQRYLYIENQYFTCSAVARALQESLSRPHGPEVVMVLPKIQDSWLAQHTMGTLSARTIAALRQSDRHGRFTVLYPEDSRLAAGTYINVHAKVMVADSRYLRVGSANLNNRSMGLDTECDLVIDASDDAKGQQEIAGTVATLAGHHLGVDGPSLLASWESTGSLTAAIAIVSINQRGPKTLEPYRGIDATGPLNGWIADLDAIDLEQPVSLERLVDDFVFRGKAARELTLAERVPAGFMLTFLVCLLLATLRFLTPLSTFLDRAFLEASFSQLGLTGPVALWFFTIFIALGSLAVPLNLLIAMTACYFGGIQALVIVLFASALLAGIGYGFGLCTNPALVERILPHSLYYLRQAVVRHSTLAMFLVRFFPIAPFQMMNIAAGLARVRLIPYFFGTMAGLLPGTLGIIVFLRCLIAAMADPTPSTAAASVAVIAMSFTVYYVLGRRLGQRGGPPRQSNRRSLRSRASREPASAGMTV